MKKGCFIKVVIVLTIITAVILYIIQNKFEEFIFEPGKKILVPVIVNNMDKEMKFVHQSTEKDSLKSLMNYYFADSNILENVTADDLGDVADLIKDISEDSTITKNDLSRINDLLNRIKQNEEPEKN